MLKLMAYADGELSGAELEEVRRWIESDNESARFVNELAGLGELVQVGHRSSTTAKAVESFDIADVVMSQVQTVEVTAAPAANVIDFNRARQRNLKVGGAVLAALALAAAVFLMARDKDEAPLARAPVPAVQPSPAPNSTGPGVEVDLAESEGNSVSVFYVPSETNATTSVMVWVDESGGK